MKEARPRGRRSGRRHTAAGRGRGRAGFTPGTERIYWGSPRGSGETTRGLSVALRNAHEPLKQWVASTLRWRRRLIRFNYKHPAGVKKMAPRSGSRSPAPRRSSAASSHRPGGTGKGQGPRLLSHASPLSAPKHICGAGGGVVCLSPTGSGMC